MSELSYLTAEQRESLQDLPFSILLPGELPGGWVLESMDFEEFEEGASFSLNLKSGEKQVSFMTTNEGIGDAPTGVRQSQHSHPELGEVHVEHEEDGDFLSDWLEVENGWSALSGKYAEDTDIDQMVHQLVAF